MVESSTVPGLLRSDTSITATISCAALTGLQFDRAVISERGYGLTRQRLLAALLDPGETQVSKVIKGTALFGAAQERGVSSISVPLLAVERHRTWARAVEIVNGISATLGGCTVSLIRVSENLYDFGVATLILDLKITLDEGTDSETVRELSKELRSSLEIALQELVRATTSDFQEAMSLEEVGGCKPPGTLLRERGILGFADPGEDEEADIGSLLWIHTVYVVGVAEEPLVEPTHRMLSQLLPSFSTRLNLPDTIVSPGLQVSVGVYAQQTLSGRQSADALINVVGDLNAWWTAIWHVDHLLFRFLSEVRSRRRVSTRRALEEQS